MGYHRRPRQIAIDQAKRETIHIRPSQEVGLANHRHDGIPDRSEDSSGFRRIPLLGPFAQAIDLEVDNGQWNSTPPHGESNVEYGIEVEAIRKPGLVVGKGRMASGTRLGFHGIGPFPGSG